MLFLAHRNGTRNWPEWHSVMLINAYLLTIALHAEKFVGGCTLLSDF